jgi:hypothetical protein
MGEVVGLEPRALRPEQHRDAEVAGVDRAQLLAAARASRIRVMTWRGRGQVPKTRWQSAERAAQVGEEPARRRGWHPPRAAA